jgi:phthalate 4,5-dioxygenase oxygenase subunit
MTWNPEGPLSPEDREAIAKETFVHQSVEPVTFRPVRNQSNNYGIDRARQKNTSMTGIHGFAAQDQAVQESMGPIVDRSKEKLGASDAGIIAMRKLLLDEIRALGKGQEPAAARHGDAYWIRSGSTLLKRDVAFDEGMRELMKAAI